MAECTLRNGYVATPGWENGPKQLWTCSSKAHKRWQNNWNNNRLVNYPDNQDGAWHHLMHRTNKDIQLIFGWQMIMTKLDIEIGFVPMMSLYIITLLKISMKDYCAIMINVSLVTLYSWWIWNTNSTVMQVCINKCLLLIQELMILIKMLY